MKKITPCKKSTLLKVLFSASLVITTPLIGFSSDMTAPTMQVNTDFSSKPYTLDSLDSAQSIEQFRYTMPYLSGEMAEATGLIFMPHGDKPKDGWRIVVWTHGTVGVADSCAPSLNPINENFKVLAESLLNEGYVIVAPDYEGLGAPGIHPYLHLESEANAAIYAVNALKNHFPNDFQGDWMVIGQSQGGQAALGTAEFANQDPFFQGAVAGAPASNLQAIIRDVAPTALAQLDSLDHSNNVPYTERQSIHAYSTLLAYAALVGVGIKAADPDFDYLELFYPEAQPLAQVAEGTNGEDGQCLDDVRNGFKASIAAFLTDNPDKKLLDYPGLNTETFHSHPVLMDFFAESQPGTKKLDKPLLIIQGEKDTSVPAVVTSALAENLQKLDSKSVELILVEGASHSEAIVLENTSAVAFIKTHMPAK